MRPDIYLSIVKRFQSTPSVGRATYYLNDCPVFSIISIHALRGEGDAQSVMPYGKSQNFNPRPPWGGRRKVSIACSISFRDFNPRPPWGGRHSPLKCGLAKEVISIHALRGEGDAYIVRAVWRMRDISIHALRGEGDVYFVAIVKGKSDFNPRPPWGGRRHWQSSRARIVHFNPRPPWGGRPRRPDGAALLRHISIHALRGEGDALVHRHP